MPDIESEGERKYPTLGNRRVRWERVLEEKSAEGSHHLPKMT